MAIIPGVIVNWKLSPRIITIPAPLTDVTIEDLQDTLLDIEDDEAGMPFPALRETAGGQVLSAGVLVGWTMKLLNAKLSFQARTGPNYVQCNVTGGNLVAVDESGDPMSPIQPTAYTQINTAASSSATIVSVNMGSGLSSEERAHLFKTLTTTKFIALN